MSIQCDRHDLMLFDYNWSDLRKLRKRCKLKQKDIAEFFGLHKVTISQWESGKVNNPLTMQMYGIFLERYYARLQGYVPAFRELGENKFKNLEEPDNANHE